MVSNRGTGVDALARWGMGILAVILLGSGLAFGQTFTAAISGVVRDSSGAVVPDATVTARHVETTLTRATRTTASGVYSLPSLPVGPYELTVEKPGFRQQVRRGITLAVAQEAVINLTLEVGQVEQTVEVTGEAPLVNTTLASTSGLITEGQVKDMPLNGRGFEQLLTLNTGIVNNRSNASGNSFSVAGNRLESNRFTINGVDYVGSNSSGVFASPDGASQQLLGVDAVREYNVLSHTYGAEYGKRAGGQISVVTMSGTNQLHGTAFEYLRNNQLDARNFFSRAAEAPPFKRNQFGGALGGPIIRDKMFLFGNYEGFRERLGVDSVLTVPSSQARLGLLPCNQAFPTGAPGSAAQQARDANCGTSLSGLNAYIPVPNLVRGTLPFFQYWPEPNGEEAQSREGFLTGTAFYRSNQGRKVGEDFGLARYDYNLSSADSVSANFTASKGLRFEPLSSDPIFFSTDARNLYTVSVQETHIFSPTVLNVSMFGWSRGRGEGETRPEDQFPDNLLFLKGPGQNNPGAIAFGGAAITSSAASIAQPNGTNPFFNQRQTFTGSDDLRLTRGRHNLSMGVWVQKIQQSGNGTGQFNAGIASFLGLLEFLQDRPSSFRGAVNPTLLNFRSTQAAWYFQDEIKVRPNLTVRLGLRDEMTTGWNERDDKAANYNFDRNGVLITQPYTGKSAFLENNAIALWQPRVGVAWDPTGAGKWSVRAGFGIHNDLQDNLYHRLAANPPFNPRVEFINTPLATIHVPILSGTPPPPSCSAETPNLRPPACSIFGPGGVDPRMHTPTIQQWALEIEREITQDVAVQLSYVGNEAYHNLVSMDTNTIRPVRCESPAGCASGGTIAGSGGQPPAIVPQGTEYIPWGNGVPNGRPNPFIASTWSWIYVGTGSYHGASASLLKRSRTGLTFKTNYTFGKVMDISSGILTTTASNDTQHVLNPYNLRLSRGIASYSLRHQFNTNFSYPLPFGQGHRLGGGATGWMDKVISGWQWNGIFTAQGGFPITPRVGLNRSGNGNGFNPDVPNRNPAFTGDVILGVDGFKKTGRYFDPLAFSLPLAGTFGNVSRGAFRGPDLINLDLSLFKRIPLNERFNLQFRAEAFNILNHANFAPPTAAVFTSSGSTSGTAGTITGTAARERQIQFALRLAF